MNRKMLLQKMVGLTLTALLLVGCGALTATPASTPTVGDIVIGPHWKVKVIKVETGDEFGPFGFEEGTKNHFVIVTLEYTYLGPDRAEFFPESVILVYTGNTGLKGWARKTALYRGEISSQVVHFAEEVIVNYLDSGETRTETFIYEFRKEYTDFRLFFPETEAIAINIAYTTQVGAEGDHG